MLVKGGPGRYGGCRISICHTRLYDVPGLYIKVLHLLIKSRWRHGVETLATNTDTLLGAISAAYPTTTTTTPHPQLHHPSPPPTHHHHAHATTTKGWYCFDRFFVISRSKSFNFPFPLIIATDALNVQFMKYIYYADGYVFLCFLLIHFVSIFMR